MNTFITLVYYANKTNLYAIIMLKLALLWYNYTSHLFIGSSLIQAYRFFDTALQTGIADLQFNNIIFTRYRQLTVQMPDRRQDVTLSSGLIA